jgi:hypothetical protein
VLLQICVMCLLGAVVALFCEGSDCCMANTLHLVELWDICDVGMSAPAFVRAKLRASAGNEDSLLSTLLPEWWCMAGCVFAAAELAWQHSNVPGYVTPTTRGSCVPPYL